MRESNSRPPESRESEYEVYAEDTDPGAVRARLVEALRRESFNLLSEASQGQLKKDRSAALIGYLKFLNEEEKLLRAKLESLSDEDLEKASK